MNGRRAKQLRRLTYGDQSTKPVPLVGNYRRYDETGVCVAPDIRTDFKDSKQRYKRQKGRCFYCNKNVRHGKLVHPKCEAVEVARQKSIQGR